jgi:hypothetical protein
MIMEAEMPPRPVRGKPMRVDVEPSMSAKTWDQDYLWYMF